MGSNEMGSYYRDPNLTFHLDERYNPGIAIPTSDNQHGENKPSDDEPQATGPARYCSVRGCTSVLPLSYTNKMCDVCRSRHRIYASTKRAKRKMEKAAMGVQNGWVPTEDDPPAIANQAASAASIVSSPENASPDHSHPPFPYPGGSWDNTALDPRLFQSTTTSELAGALTLPTPSRSRSPVHNQVSALHPSSSLGPEGPASPGSISASPFPYQLGDSAQPGQQTLQKEISVQSISEVAAVQPTGSLPPRFCSIKGCKTVMDGNALFKMCDVCRGKYKTYGTTKRKKWKEEKEKALAELEREREEQNRIRSEQGLPPLPNIGVLTWPEETIAGRAINTSIPRMCTVSHCREVLSVGYGFLRCERHRIQNRHHSKLKRVRDKDAKAQALEGFCATIAPSFQPSQMFDSPTPAPQSEMFVEGSSSDVSHVPIAEIYRMDEQKRTEEVDLNVLQNQVIILGVPPAARGVRRTNHVCCIKGCHNLLSPATPWKMCDDCRAHERTVRKIRALRESGVMVEPLPPRLPPREKKEKTPKVKKAKSSKKDKTADNGGEQSHDSTPDMAEEGEGGIVFMDPVLLNENGEARELLAPRTSRISFIMAGPEGNMAAPSSASQTSQTPSSANATLSPTKESAPSTEGPTLKKKATKKKAASKTQDSSTTEPAAPTSTPSTASSPAHRSIAPVPGPYYTSPYPSTYYPPPPPGYGMPYPPGAPYPYPAGPVPPHVVPAFPRDGLAPSPMYQPPYSAYPGYPPPYPQPYGYYPPPYGLYPPPPPTQPQLAPVRSSPAPTSNDPATVSPEPSTSTNPPPVSSSSAPNYTVGVISYVSAASGGSASAPSSMSPGFLPPAPADPSSMYSMFPVRLTDTSRTTNNDSTSSETPAAALNGSAPVMQIAGMSGERPKEGVMWVDRMPEKKKRRKADHAAVEAYMKKREENQSRADGGALEGNVMEQEAGESRAEGTGVGINGEGMSSPAAVAQGQMVQQHVAMEVDTTRSEGESARAISASQPVAPLQKPRSCANKMCGRTLTLSETGTICHRCKERMKKRAIKVKRRHKLVMPASSKLAAKHSTKVHAATEDDDGDDGMEEVMVEEVLAQSNLRTGSRNLT